ncbi:MAG TPA: hypothetical protein VD815_09970 [Candidatus Saccharimonadales bacterium]|nr:hypothetical protein [Candidatus Saccharimonadales bacterium]
MNAVADMGSSLSAIMVIIGERLGLYKALQQNGPLTPEQLSNKTNTSERYIREWLSSHASSGYIAYYSSEKKFSMSPENAIILADENNPTYILGGHQVQIYLYRRR